MRTFVNAYMSRYPRDSLLDIADGQDASVVVSFSFTVDKDNPNTIIVEQMVHDASRCRALSRHIPDDILFYDKSELKAFYKDDSIAKVMFRDLIDDVIDEIYCEICVNARWDVNIETALQWSKSKECGWMMSREQRLPHLLKWSPNGPSVYHTVTMISMFKDGEYHHPHYPAHIACTDGGSSVWLRTRPERFYKNGKLKNLVRVHGAATAHLMSWEVQYCKNGISTLNSSGVPSYFTFKAVSNITIFEYLFNHRTEKLRKFITTVLNKYPDKKVRYDYDDVTIPDDIISELRFPLEAHEEFDLMMRL